MTGSDYKLSFPCPECGGVLTIHTAAATGPCPLCHSHITAGLAVSRCEPSTATGERNNELAWDKRSFRRCSPSAKPAWKEQQPTA